MTKNVSQQTQSLPPCSCTILDNVRFVPSYFISTNLNNLHLDWNEYIFLFHRLYQKT